MTTGRCLIDILSRPISRADTVEQPFFICVNTPVGTFNDSLYSERNSIDSIHANKAAVCCLCLFSGHTCGMGAIIESHGYPDGRLVAEGALVVIILAPRHHDWQ